MLWNNKDVIPHLSESTRTEMRNPEISVAIFTFWIPGQARNDVWNLDEFFHLKIFLLCDTL